MADINQPIIIVKKKGGHGGHHGGAWKVAYADFVTAMMAFFLVMWIVGLSKPVRQAIASYFRDPSGFSKMSHGGMSPLNASEEEKKRDGRPAPIIPQDGGKQSASVASAFKAVEDAIKRDMEKNPEFAAMKDSVDIHITEEGLRVELMEKKTSLFFDTGSAALKERTIHLLQKIADELAHLKNPVVIEGHTDSQPLNGANGYSNWELSADRANSARRIMESHLTPGQVLAVRGYADRKLRVKDDPFAPSNRRVSILVAYGTKGE